MTKANTHIVPQHVGFIMDGNRRWAKARGLATLEGHAAGQLVLHDVTKYAIEQGVKYVSAYAFSTENWTRTKAEVHYLMTQVSKALRHYIQEFIDNDIRIIIVGNREGLSKTVVRSIEAAETRTAHCQRATAAICFNYGGHQEIIDAAKKIIEKGVTAEALTVDHFNAELYQPDLPPIDLVVRTSGEKRLSNFMLWRAAYSELIFRDEPWPDFTVDSLKECLLEYSQRQRRFGG